MPYLGKTPSQGVRARYQFTPDAGATSVSGADANGSTMTFTDGNYVDVYLNGVMLKAGTDYNTNTANTIASLVATVASDVVDVIVYDTFSLFGGTLEGNVTVNNGTFNVDGVVTANAGVVVDNFTLDGTTLALSSGDMTLDSAAGIILDAADGTIALHEAGNGVFGTFTRASGSLAIKSEVSNADILLKGNDNGSAITALTLDMSAAGAATFNSTVIAKAATLSRSSSNSPNVEPVLLFDNIDTVIGANENIGSIRFTTSAEDSGGDANLESGRIACFSEGGHGSTTNASALAFYTASSEAASERMRIGSDGRVYIGTTDQMGGILNLFNYGVSIGTGDSANEYRRMYWNTSNNQLQFWNGSNECVINSSGAFVDASDVNLKKDIADIEYGIDTVKSLKPRKYKMKDTNLEQIGFVAQEMETQVPEIVSTGVNPDGDEQKGIAYGQLTAVLTKALQEAIAKIETLETKVKALEE